MSDNKPTIKMRIGESTEAEKDRATKELAARLILFSNGESRNCPHCGAVAEKVKAKGAWTRVLPCGCRLWHGRAIPRAWR